MKHVAAVVALAIFAVVPAVAADDSGWRLRVDFAIVDPGGDAGRIETIGGTVRTGFDSGVGFGVRGEYLFAPRLGLDFGFLAVASADVTATSGGSAAVDLTNVTPFFAGLNIHLAPGKRVDPYLGPQLAIVRYGDIEVAAAPGFAGTSVSTDTDLGVGAILGLDVPLGEQRRWAFQTSLRYLATSIERDQGSVRVDADFDPLIFSLGLGYRW